MQYKTLIVPSTMHTAAKEGAGEALKKRRRRFFRVRQTRRLFPIHRGVLVVHPLAHLALIVLVRERYRPLEFLGESIHRRRRVFLLRRRRRLGGFASQSILLILLRLECGLVIFPRLVVFLHNFLRHHGGADVMGALSLLRSFVVQVLVVPNLWGFPSQRV